MRILVDGIHMISEMKGVGRYVANTLQHLSGVDPSLRFLVLVFRDAPSEILPQRDNIEYVHIPYWNHFWHGWWTLPRWVRRVQPDIVWIPYETSLSVERCPYVVVCHDIPQMIRDAQQFHAKDSLKFKERFCNWLDDKSVARALRGAEIVFSNSQYVARWLEKKVHVNPFRIRYAPCAPGADFCRLSQSVDIEQVRKRLGTPEGYILTFQTGDLRENFDIVPTVYQSFVESGLPQALVVAGVREHARLYVESSLAKFAWHDRVRIVPFLGADKVQELTDIYTAASVYLDPSLQEGFGMQVIEAMACGVPVVCSNRGALPEVAGNAALLVDPEDPEEMASAVIKILKNQTFSDQMKEQGYKRAACFSWERTAEVIYGGLLDVQKSAQKHLHIPQQEENGDRVHECTPQLPSQPL